MGGVESQAAVVVGGAVEIEADQQGSSQADPVPVG